jgi:hypothetical protein
VLTARWLFLSSALLLFASVAFAEGDYQRTKDGKTFVWNSEPKTNDQATWSGARDGEGYASGFGTLTWYTTQEQTVRHLGIPFTTPNVYARYFGNMVHGKFNGPVNVHSKGKTDHAIFADGVRATRWTAGPAPSRSELAAGLVSPTGGPDKHLTAKATEPAKKEIAANPEAPAKATRPAERDVAKKEKDESHTEPPAPAAGPGPNRISNAAAKAENTERQTNVSSAQTDSESIRNQPAQRPIEDTPAEKPEIGEQKSDQTSVAKATSSGGEEVRDQTAGAPKADADNSLRLLAGPPSSLHIKTVNNIPPASANPDAAPSSYTNARLTKDEVVDIADAAAHSRGYDLVEYRRLDPQYDPADEIWSLGYDQRPVDGTEEVAKHFDVIVDDKTKGTVFVSGK